MIDGSGTGYPPLRTRRAEVSCSPRRPADVPDPATLAGQAPKEISAIAWEVIR